MTKITFMSLFFIHFLLSSSPNIHEVMSYENNGGMEATNMEEEELNGLFEVMGSLLEDPNWAQSHPFPCTQTPWPGLECELLLESSTLFHVTKIHLGPDIINPPCKNSSTISISVQKLTYLKTFSLINCFTKSPSEFDFVTFSPYLEHLSLVSNPSLFGPIPSTLLSNLTNLKTLCLSDNNLTGEIPSEIGKLVSLQELDLSRNYLTGQIPDELGFLTSLTILDISSNSLHGSLPGSISKLMSLEKIDLSSNKLEGKLPYELGTGNLVLLDVSNNMLIGPFPESLAKLEKLEYLIIRNNFINTRIPLLFGSLINLRVLSLSGCGLTGEIPNVFSNLRNLTALYLDNNDLNGTVPIELGFLLNLDLLNLSRNRLRGEVLFNQEFVNRLGTRLDIRENEGLFISDESSRNKTLDPENPKPSLTLLNEGHASRGKYDSGRKILFVIFIYLLSIYYTL